MNTNLRMIPPGLSYLLAFIIIVNHLHMTEVSGNVSLAAADSKLYLPIIADQYDGCIDVTCHDEPSRDACQNKAYEIAGNMFMFNITNNECCIKTCDSKNFRNTSIYITGIAPQIVSVRYIFNCNNGGMHLVKRDVDWQNPTRAGLSVAGTLVAMGAALAPFSGGASAVIGGVAAIIVSLISLMINMFGNTEDMYQQIRQQVLHEIATDRVEIMRRQLDNWNDGTFFRYARRLNIRPKSPHQIQQELLNGQLETQAITVHDYDYLLSELRVLHNDVDLKQNKFMLTSHFGDSLAYYHEYAALNVYLLSMLIAARGNVPDSLRETYRQQLRDSAQDHYNYLMFIFGKRLIYDGSIPGM